MRSRDVWPSLVVALVMITVLLLVTVFAKPLLKLVDVDLPETVPNSHLIPVDDFDSLKKYIDENRPKR